MKSSGVSVITNDRLDIKNVQSVTPSTECAVVTE